MKSLYLSGPMSGIEEHNYPAFNAEAKRLRELGYIVVNPAEAFGGIGPHPKLKGSDFMRFHVASLLTVEGLALMEGWENSTGAKQELAVAEALGLTIAHVDQLTVPAPILSDQDRAALDTLVKVSHTMAVNKGFNDNDGYDPARDMYGDPTQVDQRLLLIVGEVVEAQEEIRVGRGLTETYYNSEKPDKPEGVPIELADVIIRVCHFAGTYGIDLSSAVALKLAYNATRPHRHGKRF